MNFLSEFKNYLLSQKNPSSRLTVKNYLSDIRKFIDWFEKTFRSDFTAEAVTQETIEYFKKSNSTLSPSSLERHVSSLRKFFHFLKLEGTIAESPFDQLDTKSQIQNTDLWHLKEFKDYLYVYNASRLTIKNYLIDIKNFLSWAEKVTFSKAEWNVKEKNIFEKINNELIGEYKSRLMGSATEAGFSPATVNRKLSSLRKFTAWAREKGYIKDVSSIEYPVLNMGRVSKLKDIPNTRYKIQTTAREYSSFPPIRLIQKVNRGALFLADAVLINPVASVVKSLEQLKWRLQGKPVFAEIKNKELIIKNLPKGFYAPLLISTKYFPFYKKALFYLRHKRPQWYKTYHSYPLTHYLHIAILVLLMSAAGFGVYQNITGKAVNPGVLGIQNPKNPPRVFSFQGRLTDNSNNPITAKTDLRFAIYDAATATGSALMWQEVDSVTPDSDGIFSVLLGNVSTMQQSLFAEHAGLYLGVTVGKTPELTPRQQLATVAYAQNSATLQGLLPITNPDAGTANVVLALDSSGNLTIGGTATPTFQATGGQFKISGNPLLLTTTSGSNGNVQIAPDGRSFIDLQKPLQNTSNNNNVTTARGALEVNDLFAVLATSSGQSAFTLNQNGAGPIISASSSGTAKFTVDNSGNTTIAGNFLPATTLSKDLGSSSLRWNNVYAGTINSAGTTTTGQATFTYSPADTTVGQSTVLLNPATAIANASLLGVAVGGVEKARIDAEGDAALGFTGGTLTPNSNPLTIYNHGTTQVASIDTAGNITSSGSFLAANGTAAVPSYAFTNSAATGLYRGGTDILGVSTAGVQRATYDASGNYTLSGGNFSQTGTGTFGTGTGAISLNGATTVTGTNTFTTGTGAVSLNGDTTVASGKNFTVTSGATSLTSAATTGTNLSIASASLTSGTAVNNTVTANAGNGQVTKGESILITDATTGGGGYTGLSVNITGSGVGSGNKYLLDLNPGDVNKEMIVDSTGALRPTQSVATNTTTVGSPSFYFKNGYFDQITANNIAGTVTTGATSSTSWTIGSTQTGDVNESLIFQRNSGSGNATLQWNAGANDLRYLTVNYPFNSTYTVADTSIGTGVNLYSGTLTNNTTAGTQKLLSLTNTGTGTTENGIYVNNTGTGLTGIEVAGTWTTGILTNNNSINAGSGTITGGAISGSSLTSTGLTQGSVVFAGTGGLLSQNNANFFWDNTNARLGIGTTSPNAALDVRSAISIGANAASGGTLRFPNNSTITMRNVLNTADLQFAFFDTGNNIVIGDTTSGKSQIVGLYANGVEQFWGSGSVARIFGPNGLALNAGAAVATFGTSVPSVQFQNGSASTPSIQFANSTGTGLYRAGTDILGISTAGSERLRIDASGNVGINTTTPVETLNVNGNQRIGSAPATATTLNGAVDASQTSITVISTTSYPTAGTLLIDSEAMTYTGTTSTTFTGITRGVLGTSAATHTTGTTVGNYLSTFIATSTTPRMVLTGAGNVGIGTTSPAATLSINGSLRTLGSNVYGLGKSLIHFDGASPTGADNAAVTENISVDSGNTYDATGLMLRNIPVATAAETNPNWRQLWIQDGPKSGTGTITNSYGLYVDVPTSGTNNYAAVFASGNVGIGTTSPQDLLHVNSSGNSPQFRIQGAGSTWGAGIGLQGIANTTFAIQDVGQIGTLGSGAIRLAINSLGNVGLGTFAPQVRLQVIGNSGDTQFIRYATSDYAAGTTGSGTSFRTIASSGNTNSSIQAFKAGNSTTGDLILQPDGGNVGIGTTAPSQLLTVNAGQIYVTGSQVSGGAGIYTDYSVTTGNGNSYGIRSLPTVANTNSGTLYANWAGAIVNTGVTQTNYYGNYIAAPTLNGTGAITNKYAFVTEASAGNVGIGTTTPGVKLAVAGTTAATSALKVANTDTTSTESISLGEVATDATTPFYIQRTGSTAASNANGVEIWNANSGFIRVGTNNTERLRIDSSGNVAIGKIPVSGNNFEIVGDRTFAGAADGNTAAIGGSTFTFNSTSNLASSLNLNPPVKGGGSNNPAIGAATLYVNGEPTWAGATTAALYVASGKSFFLGNVGIGTTSPNTSLDVTGSITSRALNTANGAVYTDSTGKLFTTATGGAGTLCLTSASGAAPLWSACSGSAATAWSSLTAPSANLALTMAANTSTFTYNATTGASTDLFKLTDTTNNTGTGYLLNVTTAAGSAAVPVHIVATATNKNGLVVDTGGGAGAGIILRDVNSTSRTVSFNQDGNAGYVTGTNLGTGASNGFFVTGASSTLRLTTDAANPITFATNNVIRETIDSSGNITDTGTVTAHQFTLDAGGEQNGITFVSRTNTKIFSPLANDVDIQSGTSQREFHFLSTAFVVGEDQSGAPLSTQTLRTTNGSSGSLNVSASTLIIAGGAGTGSGTGGSIKLQTAPAGGSGTTQNTLVDRLIIDQNGNFQVKNFSANNASANGVVYASDTSGTLAETATGGAGTLCLVSTAGGAPTWAACSGSAATSWSALTNPSANLSLSMGSNITTFTYGNTTGSSDLFKLTDTSSNTGTGYLLNLTTAASSTLKPFRVTAAGTDAIGVDNAGQVGIGTLSPSSKLDVNGGRLRISGTNSAANSIGLLMDQTMSDGTGTNVGIVSQPTVSATINALEGIQTNTGTSASAITLSSLYNIYVANPRKGAGSTITNNYGLITEALTSGTNNWAIYTSGTTQSYFGGSVGIGVTVPGSQLDISAPAGTRSLNVYQAAANSATPTLIRYQTGASATSVGFAGVYSSTGELSYQGVNGVAITGGSTGTGNLGVYVTTTGNVGLATSSPTQALDVNGNARIRNLSAANGVLYSDATGLVTQTATGGAGTLCLTSTGGGSPVFASCAGSGGSAPTAWSNIGGPTANLSMSMAAYTTTMTWNSLTGTSNLFNLTDSGSNNGTGNLVNLTTATGSTLKPFHVSAAGVEAIQVLANGNVGIGTTNPQAKLAVSNAGAEGLEIAPSGGSIVESAYNRSSSAYTSYTLDSLTWKFRPSGSASNNVVIDSSGNVGIGITAPTASLHISSSANQSMGLLSSTSSTYNANLLDLQQTNTGSTANYNFLRAIDNSNAVTRFVVTGNGKVGISTASPLTNLDVVGGTTAGTRITAATLRNNIRANTTGWGVSLAFQDDTSNPSTRIDSLADTSGNQWLEFPTSYGGTGNLQTAFKIGASTVSSGSPDYISIENGASANASNTVPTLRLTGTDTNIGMTIIPKGTGGVGIGTTNPTALLHVVGTATNFSGTSQTGTLLDSTFSTAATTQGVGLQVNFKASNASSYTMSSLYGIYLNSTLSPEANPTITNFYDMYVTAPNLNTHNVTNSYGLYLNSASNGGHGIGIYVTPASVGGSTGGFSFEAANGVGNNIGLGTDNNGVSNGQISNEIAIANASNTPGATAGQGFIYVSSGALKYQGPSTLTTLANADYAESMPFLGELNQGELVSISSVVNPASDIYNRFFVERSQKEYDDKLIGIVSSASDEPGTPTRQVALVGRVPVKVTNENGAIKKGDYITSSTIKAGYAMKALKAGRVVGVALENFTAESCAPKSGSFGLVDSSNCTGTILVFVNATHYDPNSTVAINVSSLKDYAITKIGEATYQVKDLLGNVITKSEVLATAVIGNLKAGAISAQEITAQKISADKVVSPLAEIQKIKTDTIGNLSSDRLAIKLENPTGSASAKPRLEIQNASGSAVATFDDKGNASLSGQLISRGLNTQNATISGTLRAKNIVADNITSEVSSIKYLVSGITDKISSISGTLNTKYKIPNTNTVNIASYSAQLAYIDNLNATTAVFAEGFSSLGPSSLTDTSISGQLSVGASLILANNSINVLGGDLNIQPLKQGGVSFLSGKVYIDVEGNLSVNGNATVRGTLFANVLSPIPGSDLVVKLATSSGSFVIKNASGSAVAKINSEGDATFRKLNLSLVQPAFALSENEVIATGSAGIATISARLTELTVRNNQVTPKSLIYVTPVGTASAQVPFLLRQDPGKSFTVGIEGSNGTTVPFNWLIIN